MATLRHTAEAIDRKLSLIDENKNRLPYPYEATFPTDLTDVGDGSILTSRRTGGDSESLLLKTFLLPVGTYEISLAVTDIAEEAIDSHKFSLSVIKEGSDILTGNSFTIEDPEKAIAVLLNIPYTFSADLLIKPQIVKSGEDSTVWTPYMDKIGTYVDERFNGTNAKIKVLTTRLDSLSNFGSSIQIGSTTLTEEQLIKILNFIDSIELEN